MGCTLEHGCTVDALVRYLLSLNLLEGNSLLYELETDVMG